MYLDDCVCVLSDLTWLPLLGVGRKSWYIIILLFIIIHKWMWLELLLFRRYFICIHYFYIYAKQRSKWNSGKINYNYLLNKIVISHTSIRYNHGIYECITIWCVFELQRTSLLIAYLSRDLWDTIFIGYLAVRRYNPVNFLSTAYRVVFQCRCLCHMACVEFTLVALLCSHCTCFIGADVRRPDCHADVYRERGAVVGCSFQPFERDSAMLLHRDLEL